jgi:hypothetical protein
VTVKGAGGGGQEGKVRTPFPATRGWSRHTRARWLTLQRAPGSLRDVSSRGLSLARDPRSRTGHRHLAATEPGPESSPVDLRVHPRQMGYCLLRGNRPPPLAP